MSRELSMTQLYRMTHHQSRAAVSTKKRLLNTVRELTPLLYKPFPHNSPNPFNYAIQWYIIISQVRFTLFCPRDNFKILIISDTVIFLYLTEKMWILCLITETTKTQPKVIWLKQVFCEEISNQQLGHPSPGSRSAVISQPI